jgi:hypothetical protein
MISYEEDKNKSNNETLNTNSNNSTNTNKLSLTEIQNNSSFSNPKNHTLTYLNTKSFFNLITIAIKSLQLNAPFPSELLNDELLLDFSSKSDGFLAGFEVRDNDGIYCVNEEIVKKQSGVFSDMAKQLAKGIFQSGPITLSLPVRIFEPRSMLERYTDWWVYAPILLKKAGEIGNKLEAFKNVICFSLSALYFSSGQMKPFNPMLGETFEAKFSDGSRIYMEHSSHVPCVSNYLINDVDNSYKFYGFYDITIEGTMKMVLTNNISCVAKGKNNVYLKETEQTISYQNPKLTLGGMIYGKRYVIWDGHMKYEDRQNKIKAVVFFNKSHSSLKNKRFHDVYGKIFYHDFSKEKKNTEFYENKVPKNPFPSDEKMIFSEITGSWLEGIYFDNKLYWNIKNKTPATVQPIENPIPSDSRYREDLVWLKRSMMYTDYSKDYEDYSQKWKLALEVQQRHDRTNRNEKKSKK